MSRSAPQISFYYTTHGAASIDYGTIDVDSSSAILSYHIYGHGESTYFTEAIHMSISFKEVTNASEARKESWVWISTVSEPAGVRIGSIGQTCGEALVGSIGATSHAGGGNSAVVWTKVIVPSGAASAGAVSFQLHHRYQYTGYDDDD